MYLPKALTRAVWRGVHFFGESVIKGGFAAKRLHFEYATELMPVLGIAAKRMLLEYALPPESRAHARVLIVALKRHGEYAYTAPYRGAVASATGWTAENRKMIAMTAVLLL
jgi:hypothetical protein